MTTLVEATEFIEAVTRDEAYEMTAQIRRHFIDARRQILRVYDTEAYKLMHYNSFKDWATGEFEISWQQVYNLCAAARIDNHLQLYSPTGEIYNIPVNHANELKKLKTAESQARAYQLAQEQAKAQGEDKPTANIVRNTVNIVSAEEEVKKSPYNVVRQMVANNEIKALTGKRIVKELDRLEDEPAQAYVQKLMAEHELSNPDLIYPLGHKHKNERQKGKTSKVLDEIERTGALGGVDLAKAETKHLKRANLEAQQEHVTESQETKYQKALALHLEDPENNPLPPKQVAITIWQRDAKKSAQNIIKELSDKDLDELIILLAQERGYVMTEAHLTGHPFAKKRKPETGDLLALGSPFPRNGLECKEADDLEMLVRVKVVEEAGD